MSAREWNWRGAHVAVTGGSSGIGEAVAERAAARGARLTLLARRPEPLEATAARLRAGGGEALAVPCDVADRGAVRAAMAAAVEGHGPVDALVCSAGITRPSAFVDLEDHWFTDLMDVDYFGVLWPVREVVPSMVERRHGSIVAVSSVAALIGTYGYTAYGAAKFAVRGLFEALRGELAPEGVHVGVCYPPDVDTPMLAEENTYKPAETRAISAGIKPIGPRPGRRRRRVGHRTRSPRDLLRSDDPGARPDRRHRARRVPGRVRPHRPADPRALIPPRRVG